MPAFIPYREAVHCCLIWEDGRQLFARYDPSPVHTLPEYIVQVDRYDLPNDIAQQVMRMPGGEKFQYIQLRVPKEQIEFDNPPHGVFPQYAPTYPSDWDRGN